MAFKQLSASFGVLWCKFSDVVLGKAYPSKRGRLHWKGLGWRIVFSGNVPGRYWAFLYIIDGFTGDSVENKE